VLITVLFLWKRFSFERYIFEGAFFCVKVPRLFPFVRLMRAILRWRWVCRFSGMVTQKTEILGNHLFLITTFFTTNLLWTVPESNPGLRDERPASYWFSHFTASQILLPYQIYTTSIFVPYRRQTAFLLHKPTVWRCFGR